ncbi:MAG: arsenical pump rane protein [Bryobacterales bacterium]|nr:arsenical pump rane protein [Bryobacterales bacterium]
MATRPPNGAGLSSALVWVIALAAILCILVRPRQWPEAVWACLGALLLFVFRLISLRDAGTAVAKGSDVYLFLAGMMLLSELARREGVFDWLACLAVRASRGSGARLFALVYGVGILVTVFLSNDATAVVLTPAVYAAVRKARADVLPYLFACALIANAASFVLPVSNPANLVIYGKSLPALLPWLRLFMLPSIASIAVTFAVLWVISRRQLLLPIDEHIAMAGLESRGRRAVWGIGVTGAVLLAASAAGRDLGVWTFASATLAVLIATGGRRLAPVVKSVSWSVLPLVAGLFVIVEALQHANALDYGRTALQLMAHLPAAQGSLAASFGVAALSNLMNNLPSGLLTGGAIAATATPAHLRNALLIGVDLGPNLSVTGSLATILWLVALRREGVEVSAGKFLRTGVLVMPPALLASTLALLVTS